MEKYIHSFWYGLRHRYHKYKHHLPYHHALEKFFKSKNAHLIIMLIIAAAIPITVLGVQQVQDIRQQAKEANECSQSSYPLQVFPNPAEDGKEITFKLAEGTIDEPAFQNDHFTGNGAVGCALSGGVIKCKARFNSRTKTKPQSDHTYEVHGNKCNYSVKNPDAGKPPKPTKSVKNTPKPTRDPKITKDPTTPKCEVNLSDYDCTGDNKPRLRASWDIGSDEGECSVTLNDKPFSKECQNSSENILKVDGKDLVSGTSYEIAISGDKCNQKVSEKAPDCKNAGATATPGKGTPTATPKAGSNTLGKPDLKNHKCIYDPENKNNKVKISWGGNDGITDVRYKLEYSPNGETKEGITKKEETLENIKIGTKYKYKITAIKTESTPQTAESSFDCPAPTPTKVPTPQTDGSAGADDIFKNCQNSAHMEGNKCVDSNGKECPNTSFCG